MAHVVWGASETGLYKAHVTRLDRVVFAVVQEDVDSALDDLKRDYPVAAEVSIEDIQMLCKRVENALAEVTGGLVKEIVTDYLEEREYEIEKDNRRVF